MALDLSDKTSNENDLTNNGVTESNDTPFAGSAISAQFVASQVDYAYINDANQIGLDFSITFTIEFWLKLTSLGTYQAIVSKDDDTSAALRSYMIIVTADNKLNALVSDGAGKFDYYHYNTPLVADEWNHWAITCNVGNASNITFEFFKNGISVGHGVAEISNDISAIKNSITSFGLGARQEGAGWNEYLDGILDGVRLWSGVRTPTEILDNYQKELVGDEIGLVAYYPMEPLVFPPLPVPPRGSIMGKKLAPTGYNCFIQQYIRNRFAVLPPLKTPTTTW